MPQLQFIATTTGLINQHRHQLTEFQVCERLQWKTGSIPKLVFLSPIYFLLTVDTAEVQHAKAAHFAIVAEAKSKVAYGGHHYAPAPAHYHSAPSAYHYPIIGHNGVPEETPEVKAEKAKHFALVAEAQSKSSYAPQHSAQYDDGSYDSRYENEHYYH